MGIAILIIIIGDIWLYVKGVRPENSMWREETIKWMM